MKFKIILILLVSIPFFGMSQVNFVKIKGGEEQNIKPREYVHKYQPIGSFDDSFIYLLRPDDITFHKGIVYRLEKYDLSFGFLQRKEVILNDGGKERIFNEIIYYQDKLYLFSYFANKKNKKAYLYVQTINKETLDTNNDIKTVAEIDYDDINKKFRLRAGYSISNDGTKLLVHTLVGDITYGKSGKEVAVVGPYKLEDTKEHLHVFDQNMNLVWQKNLPIQVEPTTTVFENYLIDNMANVYVTGRVFENEKEKKANYTYRKGAGLATKHLKYVQPSNYRYSILYFGNNGNESKQFFLSLDEIFAKNLTIMPKGNSLLCAGIYSSGKQISAKGVYSCQLNINTGNISKLNTKEFNSQNITPYLEQNELEKFQKATSKEEWNPFDYFLSSLSSSPSGNLTFIAEQQLIGFEEISSAASGNTAIPLHNNSDLIITRLLPDGEIAKIDIVEKSQISLYNNVSHSFGSVITDDETHVIFNEVKHKRSMFSPIDVKSTWYIKIDKLGKQTKELISQFDDFDSNTPFFNAVGAFPLPDDSGIIYPVQSFKYKSRGYEKLSFK